MAAVTENLSFAITSSTVSESPYHFSRRLATLDHLTKGRIGWNIVSSYLDSAARNLLNGGPLPEHDERYVKAQEFVEVVYQLFLSSWADDAVKFDRKTRVFTDPEKLEKLIIRENILLFLDLVLLNQLHKDCQLFYKQVLPKRFRICC